MNMRSHRSSLGIAVALAIATLLLPVRAAIGLTLTVNSTADEPAADPTIATCISTPSGKCTLRAAIMVTNFYAGPHTITLPSGTYTLTRPGYDDGALVGDLDIAHDLTIQGAGSAATIIDGNGSVTQDRVFQVLPTAKNVTLNGITIRNGISMASTVGTIGGGGLYIEGTAQVQLSDVIVDGNTGQNGGGIYANFSAQGGSLDMQHVVVRNNTATAGGVGAGGGVFASLQSGTSRIDIQDSQLYGNTADGTGGGLFVEGPSAAQWSLQRSQIYSNTAASGGGIGNFIPLMLSDSSLHDNHASMDGGAIEAFDAYSITRTTLNANTAGRYGGGIFNLQTGAIVNANFSEFAHIEQSTLSGNVAQNGGGIYHDGYITTPSVLTLLNSTVSGNTVLRVKGATGTADGGGIYVYEGTLQLLNATVAYNRVQLGFGLNVYPGDGGGLFACLRDSVTFACKASNSVITALNSVIAKNSQGNGITVDTPDDCYSVGSTGTLGYDLFGTMANCSVSGPQAGNVVGQDPLLGPLQANGGPTQTHALLAGSPAIDAGAPGGCTRNPATVVPLTTDQRGAPRPYPVGGLCDIGAFEYGSVLPPVFASAVSRKTHGAAGTFDLPLGSVATNPTTEPRIGPAQTIVFAFDKPVNGATVAITEGTAAAAAPTFSGNEVIVSLTGVANQQYVTIAVANVASTDGGTGGSGSVRVGFLAGDVNQSRVVSIADLALVNAQLAQPVTAANFIKDVNASGTLTLSDKGITNANLTKALPAP